MMKTSESSVHAQDSQPPPSPSEDHLLADDAVAEGRLPPGRSKCGVNCDAGWDDLKNYWKAKYEQLHHATKHTPGHPKFARQQLRRRVTPPAEEIDKFFKFDGDDQVIYISKEDIREARLSSQTPRIYAGQLMHLIFRTWALEKCTLTGRNGYMLNTCGIDVVCYLVGKRGRCLRSAKVKMELDDTLEWNKIVSPKNVERQWSEELCSRINLYTTIDSVRTVAKRRAALSQKSHMQR